MKYRISSQLFVMKHRNNIRRVNKRLQRYIEEPNDDNIHDIRTAIRRLEASFGLLPKKIRKKKAADKYMTSMKDLFRINSDVRDLDVIHGRLGKYNSKNEWSKLQEQLKNERGRKLTKAHAMALSINKQQIPNVIADNHSASKFRKRFDNRIRKFVNRINERMPNVVREYQAEELHQVRKDCKKLRYLLELTDKKKMKNVLKSLKSIQDMLGAIHDNEITIQYLKNQPNPGVGWLIDMETSDLKDKYGHFVQAYGGPFMQSKSIEKIIINRTG